MGVISIGVEYPNSSFRKVITSSWGHTRDATSLLSGHSYVSSIVTDPITRLRIQTDNDPTDELFGILTLYGELDEEIGGGNQFESINAQTGITYEFVLSDFVNGVTALNAADSTYDVPDGLGRKGNVITMLNQGAGVVTVTVAGSDVLGSTENKCEQGKAISILKTDTAEWWVIGGTA
jgi:hypothetical protein